MVKRRLLELNSQSFLQCNLVRAIILIFHNRLRTFAFSNDEIRHHRSIDRRVGRVGTSEWIVATVVPFMPRLTSNVSIMPSVMCVKRGSLLRAS